MNLPKIQECLANLSGACVFLCLDLNSGYYQIPVIERFISYTAFSLDGEHFEFTRMPFGLCNAPNTFQRIMNTLLTGYENVQVYLDDILFYDEFHERHLQNLKKVIEKLQTQGISINFTKSRIGAAEVRFLGHIINRDEIKPDIENTPKFIDYCPKTRKQAMRLAGFINWFRPYLRNLSQKFEYLTNKLKSSELFTWNKSDTENTKEILTETETPRL